MIDFKQKVRSGGLEFREKMRTGRQEFREKMKFHLGGIPSRGAQMKLRMKEIIPPLRGSAGNSTRDTSSTEQTPEGGEEQLLAAGLGAVGISAANANNPPLEGGSSTTVPPTALSPPILRPLAQLHLLSGQRDPRLVGGAGAVALTTSSTSTSATTEGKTEGTTTTSDLTATQPVHQSADPQKKRGSTFRQRTLVPKKISSGLSPMKNWVQSGFARRPAIFQSRASKSRESASGSPTGGGGGQSNSNFGIIGINRIRSSIRIRKSSPADDHDHDNPFVEDHDVNHDELSSLKPEPGSPLSPGSNVGGLFLSLSPSAIISSPIISLRSKSNSSVGGLLIPDHISEYSFHSVLSKNALDMDYRMFLQDDEQVEDRDDPQDELLDAINAEKSRTSDGRYVSANSAASPGMENGKSASTGAEQFENNPNRPEGKMSSIMERNNWRVLSAEENPAQLGRLGSGRPNPGPQYLPDPAFARDALHAWSASVLVQLAGEAEKLFDLPVKKRGPKALGPAARPPIVQSPTAFDCLVCHTSDLPIYSTHPESFVQELRRKGDGRFFFVCNWCLYPRHIVFIWGIEKETFETDKLLQKFIFEMSAKERSQRMNIVSKMVRGPWIIESANGLWNTAKIKTSWTLGDGFLEMSQDILGTYATRAIFSVCHSASPRLVLDMGMLIERWEGDDAELGEVEGERMLGCCCMCAPNFDKFRVIG
eukprot:CAMPEP_0178982504 /NCGR_PEP_ID=MMETSP0795-20121207/533_1 /TAXON_ID=88552 /ORGANISM="Amoebophrya sp., Strain Ameob2" /LENGTH=706 /DNA_ID=CAMNT_0020673157 /DNA_START=154 /DNA_END=2275 /DNA_ORIENTATION=+